ncbi:DUF397 domain-containing protein [Kitasatospora aureofaciens]|uniref:DUF397 domain-containing protein n=1 Tax=Kitasatospora aureofaciens TaxID=1894 RepID=UPI001C444D01|nr:DUF397 domain-containing protein [Kitasatospora aureofaciens]MBV6698632.1 DUF397 domain-containing protein [Kitasatospora aureofaciens]
MSHLAWQKSSFSNADGGSTCLELAAGNGDVRHVRESDEPNTIVTTTTVKLRAFILGAKAGEFDHLI